MKRKMTQEELKRAHIKIDKDDDFNLYVNENNKWWCVGNISDNDYAKIRIKMYKYCPELQYLYDKY